MKKLICFLLMTAVLILFSENKAYASDTRFIQDDYGTSEVGIVYEEAYDLCKDGVIGEIVDDYAAYSFLLANLNTISVDKHVYIPESVYDGLTREEVKTVKNFVNRINELIDMDIISVSKKLKITEKKVNFQRNIKQNPGEYYSPQAAIMHILEECEEHAAELKNVYDNALFGTKHIVAGMYFAERVKGGGIWDYKVFLGTNNRYTDPELGTLSGEEIGNFHYGFVGSVCFEPNTLKKLAGAVQIYSGTSDPKYWRSYFDDPRDQADIQWGINVYNARHPQ